jgi:hypothetical protein
MVKRDFKKEGRDICPRKMHVSIYIIQDQPNSSFIRDRCISPFVWGICHVFGVFGKLYSKFWHFVFIQKHYYHDILSSFDQLANLNRNDVQHTL